MLVLIMGGSDSGSLIVKCGLKAIDLTEQFDLSGRLEIERVLLFEKMSSTLSLKY